LALCDAQGCPQKIEEAPPLEIKPAPASPKSPRQKQNSPPRRKRRSFLPTSQASRLRKSSKNPPSQTPPSPNHRPQPSDTSEAVVKKAKTKIAANIEDPAYAEFDDMKRALRKNTFGQPIDTICGRVKGKRKSGERTGEMQFLYLVKEDTAYIVVDGNSESLAAVAYRTICDSPDARRSVNPYDKTQSPFRIAIVQGVARARAARSP
jgi:hypothetical protein